MNIHFYEQIFKFSRVVMSILYTCQQQFLKFEATGYNSNLKKNSPEIKFWHFWQSPFVLLFSARSWWLLQLHRVLRVGRHERAVHDAVLLWGANSRLPNAVGGVLPLLPHAAAMRCRRPRPPGKVAQFTTPTISAGHRSRPPRLRFRSQKH